MPQREYDMAFPANVPGRARIPPGTTGGTAGHMLHACMHACINECQVTTYRLFPLLLLSVVLTTTSQTSIPCSLSVWVY